MAGEGDKTKWVGIRKTDPAEAIPIILGGGSPGSGEGDKTKWVGIRPTDPPESIPVTLADGISGNPTVGDMKLAYNAVLNPDANEWHTALDVTDSGFLKNIGMNFTGANMDKQHLRVSFDGVTGDDLDLGAVYLVWAVDTGAGASSSIILNFGNSRFETSLKVEHMSDTTVFGSMQIGVMYMLDQ